MSKFKSKEEYFSFSKRLVVIPTEDIKKLFLKYKVKLPLFIHAFLLRETIRPKVFEDKIYSTYTDELKYRLRGYDNFSLYPLEKLIEKYNLDFELSRYKELLFNIIFINMNKLSLKNNFINELEQLQHNYTVDLEVMKYSEFYELIKEFFYEAKGYLDGVKLTDWNEELLSSYTLGDLKALGNKYNVNVPRRINKSKLIAILTAKFQLTEDESKLLSKKSVLDLEIYAKEKGFKISIDLKKKDMIEFIQFALDMYHKPIEEDNFNYDIPLESREEEVVSDIEAEEVIEESISEEVIPTVEEEVEEITKVVEEEEIEEITKAVEEKTEIKEEKLSEKVSKEEKISKKQIVLPEGEKIKEEPEKIEKEEKSEEENVQEELKEEVLTEESLLSEEEKELLDEKINQIIKKFYKKRRRRRIIWFIIIVLVLAIIGFSGYSYYYYTVLNQGNLPFNLPVFWN